MGLLDDAIREHLDLKRRRGGDPAEIARAEQEALAPVRREPEAAEESHPEPVHHDEHAAEEHAHDAGEAPHADAAPQELFDLHEPVPPEPEPEAAPEPQREPAAPPRERAPEPEPHPGDIVLQPTTEFRVEDLHDDEPAGEAPPHEAPPHDDDVLEETPDFLQETPEHDRLWFEQRPPRDFDFDG